MYKKIKALIKRLFPRNILFRYEDQMRHIVYLFYRGKGYSCNICGKAFRKFIKTESEDKLCPNCGSIARSRRLWNIISTNYLSENCTVLDFSPPRYMYKMMKKYKSINYISSAYDGDFLADFKYDITNIDISDKQVDLIICYHILEHIVDDVKAMKELYRILKNGGVCVIQTPFKEGDIYEDYSITTPEERFMHFGQNDHVRIYSLNGLKSRLEDCGFLVDVADFEDEIDNPFGYSAKESVLICKKQR